LVVAALAPTSRVQWIRDHYVGLPIARRLANNFGQAIGEPVAEPRYLFVLEPNNGLGKRVIVRCKIPSAPKSVEIRHAQATSTISALQHEWPLKRPPAILAHHLDDAVEAGKAIVTDGRAAGVGERIA